MPKISFEGIVRGQSKESQLADKTKIKFSIVSSVLDEQGNRPNWKSTCILTTEVRLVGHNYYERWIEAWTGETNHIDRTFRHGNLTLPEVVAMAQSEHEKYLDKLKKYRTEDLSYMCPLPADFFD